MDLTGLQLDRSEVVGEAPAAPLRTASATPSTTALRKASSLGFYGFGAALCLWIVAYGSGMVPWLGSARVDETIAPFTTTRVGNMSFGLGTMLLFKGQTAYYDYNSSDPHGEITFDVKPLSVLGYSRAMVRVKGARQGRLEFPIAHTGLYRFQHEPALGRRYGRTAYTVSWGAR